MRLVLFGPPGAGKGTQAQRLEEKHGWPHISTGALFRKAIKEETALGKEAKDYLEQGLLVPDDITGNLVTERLKEGDAAAGFILDGYPRNLEQAEYLSHLTVLQGVLEIYLSAKEVVKRLSGRRVCSLCGATFHLHYNPPQQVGHCDLCGGELLQRKDDTRSTILSRLQVYQKETEPLSQYYKQQGLLRRVPGDGSIQEVTSLLMQIIDNEVSSCPGEDGP